MRFRSYPKRNHSTLSHCVLVRLRNDSTLGGFDKTYCGLRDCHRTVHRCDLCWIGSYWGSQAAQYRGSPRRCVRISGLGNFELGISMTTYVNAVPRTVALSIYIVFRYTPYRPTSLRAFVVWAQIIIAVSGFVLLAGLGLIVGSMYLTRRGQRSQSTKRTAFENGAVLARHRQRT